MICRVHRRDHPGGAPARRLAPHHPHHRGGGHGRRRDHHPGPVRLRHPRRGCQRQAASAGTARPASGRPGAFLGPGALLRRRLASASSASASCSSCIVLLTGSLIVAGLGGFTGAARPAVLAAGLHEEAADQQVHDRTSERHGHHRPRHSRRPSAGRLHPRNRQLDERSAADGVSAGRGRTDHGHSPVGFARADGGTRSRAGSDLLRDRDHHPDQGRRQSCPRRSATFRACCASARR
jgi:hypothetical protein